MLNKQIRAILSAARPRGWVLEPEAKRLFSLAGFEVPRHKWAAEQAEALAFAESIGYPLAAKVVSAAVIHKSEAGGVMLGLKGQAELKEAWKRFRRIKGFAGMLVEEMISGVELIVGAKVDYQFGPVILLGIGGTGVELYRDTSLRMAPLNEAAVASMTRDLKAQPLLEGYRGSKPVNVPKMTEALIKFSRLVMRMEDFISSIDLNPVMCTPKKCVIADARIMLQPPKGRSANDLEA